MVQINRVYTKVGDGGETALIGGQRVRKDSLRIECYGTVDELSAHLGVVRAKLDREKASHPVLSATVRIQSELFNLGAALASPDPERDVPTIAPRHVEVLESEMDGLLVSLEPLRSFVLPGAGEVSAHLHVARTVCRRAERLVVALSSREAVPSNAIKYLNRLSDALFVFARYAAKSEGIPEPLWHPEET